MLLTKMCIILITDQHILANLEEEKVLVFTPARRIGGRRVICYDDRYVLKLAADTGGIVVSNDNYRDLIEENTEFRKVVEERLLMYSFVNDRYFKFITFVHVLIDLRRRRVQIRQFIYSTNMKLSPYK